MQVLLYFFMAYLPYVYFRCLSDCTQMWVGGGEEKIMFVNLADKKTSNYVCLTYSGNLPHILHHDVG